MIKPLTLKISLLNFTKERTILKKYCKLRTILIIFLHDIQQRPELPEDKMLGDDSSVKEERVFSRERERETSGGIVQGSIQFNEARRRDNPDAIDCSSPRIVEPKPMSRWDRSTLSSSSSSLFVSLSRLCSARCRITTSCWR